MKRAKSLEKRQHKAIEEKSKLLKNIEEVEELTLAFQPKESGVLLDVCQLQIQYSHKILFEPISFEMRKGERIWLRGKNGCGKSSIIKLLLGEEIPYTGSIQRVGKISYVCQDTSFLRGTLPMFIQEEKIEETHFKNTLYKLGITERQFEKDLNEWSEGQKKKLLIAKSLCEQAEIYIWDEPLNFIDLLSRIQIEELILEKNPTMLFVEHDQCFGEQIATQRIDVL